MRMMKKWGLVTTMLAAAIGFSCLMAGCERTVSREESTKVKSDGTVQTKEKTVTEGSDGTVTKTERKSTSTNSP